MSTKTTIKIIKRGERRHAPTVNGSEAAVKKTAQETAREMVATVSEWVSEFQQKRRTETKQAIKTLFADSTPEVSKA